MLVIGLLVVAMILSIVIIFKSATLVKDINSNRASQIIYCGIGLLVLLSVALVSLIA